ncbi:response regulator [Pseudobacteriovorax antillogorgiicola]|uniref:Response regulator receiver domain-containing protein n=1 Tax=Pseudobacteriovorax antillogorgiicola TaxID=1513793 RepID=A0A1Y6CU23_9BACT|nr:response regulator [Pseudobacteriovorax antillogorgiicola]TCS44830.1 response regulator receiver domain-containing protein [Pseudobacteriovorax antillogorgiicola]SMF77151.1 Response regulator receiver domain-containing protein [Pseudobacteriovorax antillogorgiicola]
MANDTSNMRIAVIDDEADLLDMYTWELIDHGFKPESFISSVEGQKSILEGNFDLIISDVRMPSLNGLLLLQSIQAEMKHPPPFIFVTGYSKYHRDELIEAGAKEVFMKPIDVEKIVKWIDNYFDNKKAS